VVVDQSDPFANDPQRHPALLVHNNKPMNAELPRDLMLDNWITPRELFFIRHHHPVPVVDTSNYTLKLGGKGVKPILISLHELRTHFHKKEVVATLQCGGNRRHGMNAVHKTSGIDWGFGAISTAKWGGVPLRDILLYAGRWVSRWCYVSRRLLISQQFEGLIQSTVVPIMLIIIRAIAIHILKLSSVLYRCITAPTYYYSSRYLTCTSTALLLVHT
jgi:hypothetical protein